MNYEMMKYVLMSICKIEGLLLLIPVFVSVIYKEYQIAGKMAIVAIAFALIGMVFTRKKPRKIDIFAKDGLIIVGITWIIFSIIGAIPFYVTGSIPSFIDAFFETVSGFTTTGSTILTDIESLSKGILFWRAFTHWIGGMGVLVFVMAIIPLAGRNSMSIMKAEVPGPTVDKLVPKAKQTAKLLYIIYIGLTGLEVVLLMIGKMPLYDSVVHAFATAGTGGFSIKSASVGYYQSAYIDWVVTIFMVLFGINFNLFYLAILNKFNRIARSEELRVYLAIIVVSTLLISINVYSMYNSISDSIRYSAFQVASIITTTGFMNTDFNLWPQFSKSILLILMIVGACAGSTGGGVKVSRIIIIAKHMRIELKKIIHPRSVSNVKVDGKIVENNVIRSVSGYIMIYFMLILFSFLLISINGFDFETSITSVITCINNVGPGLGSLVGPIGSFSMFSDFSKIVLSIDMLLGRLEIFPILILFSPRIYKRRF
ncbi:TrkH family potassium uptake protein [Peptostreptococcus porci]|uniref:TrkH family potassium uptake protein n=1 Tax=Peptostreptococcus porci TaxID=2652282 RepID=UPI0023EF72DE|nr:TrkH family potassium uptake protein [Peptostreptococcus porci]MDD7183728.1 TrkH family potassium uptake protein [Peptostreptococcus porci]MDY5436119.1 TrkH family potassium uptake protein [Peptostreptococcus porci]MDY5963628.1 TrkH family potassium uptake protein [Peptostreptococcus porci]